VTDTRTLAVHVVALRVLADRVKDRTAEVKAELQAQLDVGDRKNAQLPNGDSVGAITYTRGRSGARVADENAFTEWVTANYPDELVTTVRSSFRDAVLSNAKNDGAAVTANGEIIPGVELYHSEPYLSAKPLPGAAEVILSAVRLDHVLAIQAADPPDYDPTEGE
jgi:hypothetical protein